MNKKVNRIYLPNGCYISQMKVLPANWDKSIKSMKGKNGKIKDWILYYRYYNPQVKDENGKIKPYLERIKRMNSFTNWEERQAAVQDLKDNEMMLLKMGYNPAKKAIESSQDKISLNTPLSFALEYAIQKMKVIDRVRDEAKNILKHVKEVFILLGYDIIPLGEVEPKHIADTLEYLQNNMSYVLDIMKVKGVETKAKEEFTPAKYNRYRANLLMLFKVLKKQLHIIKTNPVEDTEKAKKIKKLRSIPTAQEIEVISKRLYIYHRDLWRFWNIFHQSGSRETELLLVKGEKVNLNAQFFKRIVNKRKEGPVEVQTIITDAALPFWKEAMKNCAPDQYVFAKNLKPGDVPIKANQINKYWRKYVKIPLKTNISFYDFKHHFTTQMRAILTAEELAGHNAHTSTEMVNTVYDVEAILREQNKIRKRAIPLAGPYPTNLNTMTDDFSQNL